MYTAVKQTILDKIKAYDRIMIFRHIRLDGDCLGASKGLKALIRATWPEKEVWLYDGQTSSLQDFMGPDDEAPAEELYADALAIVVDTATADRVSNKKFTLCKEIIKIDHHIPVEQYGDIQWVEEHKSSACELIVEFWETFKDQLVLTPEAATHLYLGMVTDTGRFRFEGVGGDTLRRAGALLDTGINTEQMYANLYLDDFTYLKFKSEIYNKMQITPNGVAWVLVDREIQERFGLTHEQASAAVGLMDSIRGSIAWCAFIDGGAADGSLRVRLRSRFVTINSVAERYHGGGHANASGATVFSMEEKEALLRDLDEHVRLYKEQNEGWL